MTLAGRLRRWRYAKAIRKRDLIYAQADEPGRRESLQLQWLNKEWDRVLTDVAYYRERLEDWNLPRRFRSLEEFAERVPPTTRDQIQRHGKRMASDGPGADFHRTTGGSTSAPVQIPAWNSEPLFNHPDMWLGRSWYGVSPASRLFLLWGHAHLLGTGLRGRVNALTRQINDRLLGYYRASAYDVQPEAMRRVCDRLLRFRPDYAIGYSVALDQFARANQHRRDEIRALGLRVVIATAEAFPTDLSAELIEDLFGCPVAMEYGAVESGAIAHSHPDGGFRVFWRTTLLEAERSNSAHHTVRVTSLYPRCFPLVRYEIGDEVDPLDPAAARVVSLDRFRRVLGRCNDYVTLGDGARIHSEVFSHALRPCPEINSFQVVRTGGGLRIRFVSSTGLPEPQAAGIRERLRKVHPDLASAVLERVEQLERTIAGKTLMIINELAGTLVTRERP